MGTVSLLNGLKNLLIFSMIIVGLLKGFCLQMIMVSPEIHLVKNK